MYCWDNCEWAIFLSKLNEEDNYQPLDNYNKRWYRENKEYKKKYLQYYRLENKEKISKWNKEYYYKKKDIK